MEILRKNKSATVAELSAELMVSEETIRRDLRQLEKEKLLNRIHGGAYLGNLVQQTIPVKQLFETYKKEKEIIAQICFDLVQDGDTVMLDSSTTAFYVAKLLVQNKNITVITNSLEIAYVLSSSDSVNVICAGGILSSKHQAFMDDTAQSCLERFYADKCFVSCTGISLDHGLTDSTPAQGKMRQIMLKHAQKRICIADDTKIGKITLSKIAPLSDIDCLVTNKKPPEEWLVELGNRNIECLYPLTVERDI